MKTASGPKFESNKLSRSMISSPLKKSKRMAQEMFFP